jgi:hypothetical protein
LLTLRNETSDAATQTTPSEDGPVTFEQLSDAAIDELCGRSDPTILALAAEVKRLRSGIREHQRQTGHALCWLNDLDLWRLLDPQADYPHATLPVREEFFGQCRTYYESRLTGVEYEEPQPNTTIQVKGKATP